MQPSNVRQAVCGQASETSDTSGSSLWGDLLGVDIQGGTLSGHHTVADLQGRMLDREQTPLGWDGVVSKGT